MKKITALIIFTAFITSCNASEEPAAVTETPAVTSVTTIVSTAIAENKTDGEALYEAEYAEAVRQRDISSDVRFTGIEKTTDIKYGNLLQNLKNTALPGLICPDNENGILYFTNLSENETLCKLEDGVITELLPVTAKAINLWDGFLYYICDTESPTEIPRNSTGEFRVKYTGDIYRYDIETGENELLIQTNAYNLIVSDFGLDFSAGENYSCEKYTFGTSERYYHADFDGSSITETGTFPIIDDYLGIYYGENRLEANDGAFVLRNTDTGSLTELISRKETCDSAVIAEDVFYYRPNFKNYRLNEKGNTVSRNALTAINLITGEITEYDNLGFTTDYAVIDGRIYMCNGLNFILLENGQKKPMLLELHGMNDGRHEFIALYTDGKTLYAADDRLGIYVVEPTPYGNGLEYYEIGGSSAYEEEK